MSHYRLTLSLTALLCALAILACTPAADDGSGSCGAGQVKNAAGVCVAAAADSDETEGGSEAETADLVGKKIAELGIADAKQIGKLVGAIMKDFKGKVDAALVKKIATEKLS